MKKQIKLFIALMFASSMAHAQLTLSGDTLHVSSGAVFYVNTNFSATDSAQLSLKDTLHLTGNLTLDSGVVVTGNGFVNLTGSTAQQVFAAGVPISKLRLDNASGAQLRSAAQVSDSLVFEKGILNINDRNLTVGTPGLDSGSVSGACATAYVQTSGMGELLRHVSGTTKFPVGNGSYSPAVLRPSQAATFGVRAEDTLYENYFPQNNPYLGNAVNQGWYVSQTGPGTTSLGLYWQAAEELPGFDRNSSGIFIYDGQAGQWTATSPPASASVQGNLFGQSSAGIGSFNTYFSVQSIAQNCQPTAANLFLSSCDSVVSPSGKYVWTTSGIYTDTLVNAAGCDSLLTVNVDVSPLQVTAFHLVQANTGAVLAEITNGYVINKAAIIGPFSVVASVCNPPVGSVVFNLNGTNVQTESQLPYAINGDTPPGNYRPWKPAVGNYLLVGTAYSNGGGNGTAGTSYAVSFSVVDSISTDCNGDVGGSAFYDGCNICSGGNSGHVSNSDKDGCGVCFGNNANKDCNGDCFGTAVTDSCGVCTEGNTGLVFNASCNVDCNGDLNGTATLDDCNICSGGNTGHVANSDQDTCGVCYGDNLSCAPCQPLEIIALTLVDVSSSNDIALLTNGFVIDKSAIGPFSVRADACSQAAIGSVRFFVNGSLFQNENIAPYAIKGDNTSGYKPWNPAPGNYTIEARPFSGGNGNGTQGISETVTITITNGPPAADCNGDAGGSAFINDCSECVGGNTGKPADFGKDDCGVCFGNNEDKDCAGVCFGTAAYDACGDCSGGTTGIAPNSGCNIDCNGDPNGTAYLDSCGVCVAGSTGRTPNADKDTCGVCFGNNLSCAPCQPLQVTSLTLMQTGTAGPIRILNQQDTLIKSQLPNFSVRADVCDPASVKNVRFYLNGAFSQNENIAPYAIAGDNSGSFKPWNVPAGFYQLEARPYSSTNGNGTAGISKIIDLWIFDNEPLASIAGNGSGDPTENPAHQRNAEDGTGNTQTGTAALNETDFSLTVEGLAMRLFPNPTTGALTVETENAGDDSELMLLDMSGKLLRMVTQAKVSGAHRTYSLYLGDLPKGIYLVKLRSGSEIRTKRVVRE